MSQQVNSVVLITGGSNGIGLALANVFARNGHNLLLVAREPRRLDQTSLDIQKMHGVTCEYIAFDLSQHDSAFQLFKEIKKRGITVNILVNNAGFGTYGRYGDIDPERSCQEMQLNMLNLALLTNLFLKEMLTRRNGKILNVASTAAYQPGPLMAVYYATKSFVVSFSEALSKEVKGTGVTVAVLCPGPTETEFQRHAGMASMHLLRKFFMMDAHTVAECAYQGLMKSRRTIIPGILNTIVAYVARILPKRILLAVVYYLHKRRG